MATTIVTTPRPRENMIHRVVELAGEEVSSGVGVVFPPPSGVAMDGGRHCASFCLIERHVLAPKSNAQMSLRPQARGLMYA